MAKITLNDDVQQTSEPNSYYLKYENNELAPLTKEQKEFVKFAKENRDQMDDETFAAMLIDMAKQGIFEDSLDACRAVFTFKDHSEDIIEIHAIQSIRMPLRDRVKIENIIYAVRSGFISFDQYLDAYREAVSEL